MLASGTVIARAHLRRQLRHELCHAPRLCPRGANEGQQDDNNVQPAHDHSEHELRHLHHQCQPKVGGEQANMLQVLCGFRFYVVTCGMRMELYHVIVPICLNMIQRFSKCGVPIPVRIPSWCSCTETTHGLHGRRSDSHAYCAVLLA